MNNAEKRKKKYLLFPLLFSLLFLLSVSFVFAISASELWVEWGYNDAGTQNRLGDSLSYGDVTNLTEYSQTSYGSNYQPLVTDLDFDGNLDIVVQSDNYLLVYNSTWGLKAQKLISLSGQPTLTTVSDLDNNGFTSYESYILTHNRTNIFIYDFNGSILTELIQINVSDDISLKTNGFKCVFNANDDSEACFIKYLRYSNNSVWENESYRVNGGHLNFIIHPTCHNTTCITSILYWDFDELNNTLTTIPNFYNLDDGTLSKEMIMWSDDDSDTNYGYSVYYTTSNTRYISKDDLITTGNPTDTYGFNNPIMYDLNTGGDAEIYFVHSYFEAFGEGSIARIYCYDTAGNACSGFPYLMAESFDRTSGSNSQAHSNPTISEMGGTKGICAFGHTYSSGSVGEGGDEGRIVCLDGSGNVLEEVHCDISWGSGGSSASCSTAWGWGSRVNKRMTSADFNNNGYDDFLLSYGIVDLSINSSLDNIWDQTGGIWNIPIDLDGDVLYDILRFNSGGGQTFLTGGANVGASITEVSSDTGSPSCIGESVAFTITDYTDPEFDAIRLKIDCYGNGTYTGWSLSSFAPEQTCIYTRYGSFQTTFAITDATNYPVITDTLIGTWVVDSGNCFTSGTGGGVAFEGVANATGFNAYHINMTAVNQMTGGDTGLDGYQSRIFDWDGSGCNDWTFLRGVCPAWKWATQGLEDMWDWIFTAFAIFLAFLLVLVIGWFFFMKKERVIPMRV